MNSLPLISHRLFVAAIGNEGRAHDRQRRPEKAPAEAAGQDCLVALIAAQETGPKINGDYRPFDVLSHRAQA